MKDKKVSKSESILKVKKKDSKKKSTKIFSKEFMSSLTPKWIASYLPEKWAKDQSDDEESNCAEDKIAPVEATPAIYSQFANVPLIQRYKVTGGQSTSSAAAKSTSTSSAADSIFKNYKQLPRVAGASDTRLKRSATTVAGGAPAAAAGEIRSRPVRRIGSLCNVRPPTLWTRDHKSDAMRVSVRRSPTSSSSSVATPIRRSTYAALESERCSENREFLSPSPSRRFRGSTADDLTCDLTSDSQRFQQLANTSSSYDAYKQRMIILSKNSLNSQLYGTLTKEDANNSKLVDLSSNNDSSISHQLGVSTTMSQWGVSSRHSLSETFAGEASSARIVSTRGGNTHGFDDAASYSSSATTSAAAVAVVAATETSPEPSAANDSHLRFMHTLVNSPGIKDIVCSLISDFVCGELFNSVKRQTSHDNLMPQKRFKTETKVFEKKNSVFPKFSVDQCDDKPLDKTPATDSLSTMFGSRIKSKPSSKSYSFYHSTIQSTGFGSTDSRLSKSTFSVDNNRSSVHADKKWECSVCLSQNAHTRMKCPTCNTTQPQNKTESESKATSSLSAMFSSKASGKWECPTCMCSNDATMMKCPACETMQPKAKPIAEPEVNKNLPAVSKANSLSAMFSSKASSKWECPTCMCSNDATMTKCPACETLQPKAKSIAVKENLPVVSKANSLSAMFSSKASGKWECPTCMCSNDGTMPKCPACETLQPGTKPKVSDDIAPCATLSKPLFTFGSPIVNAAAKKMPPPTETFNLAGKSGNCLGFGEPDESKKTSAVFGANFGAKKDGADQLLKATPFKFGKPAPVSSAGQTFEAPVFTAEDKLAKFNGLTSPADESKVDCKPTSPPFAFGQETIVTAMKPNFTFTAAKPDFTFTEAKPDFTFTAPSNVFNNSKKPFTTNTSNTEFAFEKLKDLGPASKVQDVMEFNPTFGNLIFIK